MSDFLEYTLDKFTFRVATDRNYNSAGVWAKEENELIRIGLSDFWQQRSGDVAFAEVLKPGTNLGWDDEVAIIETIKVDISLPSPAGGTIVEVNPAMEMEPEVINQDPYGKGWLVVIKPTGWLADKARLLTPEAYYEHMKREAEEEAKHL